MAPQDPSLSETPQPAESDLPVYTRAEVSKRSDLLIVENRVYSAKRFQSVHPGSSIFVSMFGGRDATEAFMEYHCRHFPVKRMEEYCEGMLASEETPVKMDEDYLKLTAEVLKELPDRGFAPLTYWPKLLLIVGATFATEIYMFTVERTVLMSLFLGWLFALIGLNIQHDANHGTFSKKGEINWLFGLFQDYIGGSSILWLQEHVVLHHLFTNDTEMDPDIALGAPMIKLNPAHPTLPWYSYQYLYVFPGQFMFGFKILFLDCIELLRYQWVGHKVSSLANYMYIPSIVMKTLFFVRFLILPFYLKPTFHTLVCVMITIMMGAGYLAFFFTISHNFKHVKHVGPGGDLKRDATFIQRQVETSCNVGGYWLGVMNGGLNYQIEHHLFPRVHHSYYHFIAPKVKKFCEAKGIRYVHYPTIAENVHDMMEYLIEQGKYEGKMTIGRTVDTLWKILTDKHH